MTGSPPMPGTELTSGWDDVVVSLTRVRRRLHESVDDPDLAEQSFAVIQALLHAPDQRLPITRLARDLEMTVGGFSRVADRMAREHLIDRRGSTGDRRLVYATLTDRGRELAQRATRQYADALRRVLPATLTPGRLTEVARIMRVLGEAAQVYPGRDAGETASPQPTSAGVLSVRDPALPDRRERGRPQN